MAFTSVRKKVKTRTQQKHNRISAGQSQKQAQSESTKRTTNPNEKQNKKCLFYKLKITTFAFIQSLPAQAQTKKVATSVQKEGETHPNL